MLDLSLPESLPCLLKLPSLEYFATEKMGSSVSKKCEDIGSQIGEKVQKAQVSNRNFAQKVVKWQN